MPGARSHLHVSHIQTGHIHDLTAHHTPTYMRKKVCSATVARPFLELFPLPGAAGRERNCLPEQKGERQGFLVQSVPSLDRLIKVWVWFFLSLLQRKKHPFREIYQA